MVTGFEPVMKVLQTSALPLGYTTIKYPRLELQTVKNDDGVKVFFITTWLKPNQGRYMGIEPMRAGSTNRCVNHFTNTAKILKSRDRGSRTPTDGFGDHSSTIKLYPYKKWRGEDSNLRTRRSGFTVRRV